MREDFNSILEKNLEDIETLARLKDVSNTDWIFDLRKAISMSILKYEGYSELKSIKSRIYDNEIEGSKNIFPAKDIALAKFLNNSLIKQDVLKPYGSENERTLPNSMIYRVENAVVICTPTSIAIIDSNDRLIKKASHNAAEAVHIWWRKNKTDVGTKKLEKACFISSQQTFNLGHWYIDTLSKYIYFLNEMSDALGNEINDMTVITDCEHKLVSTSLNKLNVGSIDYSLPYSIYEVKELFVPLIPSFDKRVDIAKEFIRKHYVSKPVESITSKRIYLSRQKQKRRKIINHAVIDEILKKEGFKTVYPEEHDIDKVMTLISNAEVVIGPNGAAMCNMLGTSENTKIGIVFPKTHLDDYYFRVANALGSRTLGCIFSEVNDESWSIQRMIHNYYYPDVGGDYFVEYSRFENLVRSLCH